MARRPLRELARLLDAELARGELGGLRRGLDLLERGLARGRGFGPNGENAVVCGAELASG